VTVTGAVDDDLCEIELPMGLLELSPYDRVGKQVVKLDGSRYRVAYGAGHAGASVGTAYSESLTGKPICIVTVGVYVHLDSSQCTVGDGEAR